MAQSVFLASLWLAAASAQQNFSIGQWTGMFSGGSGVLESLRPTSDSSFDFSPSDYFSLRNGTSNYHTGDITLRYRQAGVQDWTQVDTAAQRPTNPISSIPKGSLLHSDFSNVFPGTSPVLSISRDWINEAGDLVLQATVKNVAKYQVELGAFGFPIEFNNIFTNRTADDTTSKCVLLDPYIGLGAGYVQVTRLTGMGPNMVITPYNKNSKFEAWEFIQEDGDQPCAYQSQVFEGNYAWQTLTKAYAESEWSSVDPWNAATSQVLNPSQSVVFALRFSLAQKVYDIESAVSSRGLPVAVGIPGYILPQDITGSLFLDYPSSVKSIAVTPSGALTFTPSTASNSSWKAYKVSAASSAFGRTLVTITYADGTVQTVHYNVARPASESASLLSNFLTTKQWFTDTSDPFRRAPSVISYDHSVSQQVLQENRVWIAGISDEGGAGSFVAAAMKTSVHPNETEVGKLEEMVNQTIWGSLQFSSGNQTYGVKRSVFFYEPDAVPGYTYNPSINFGGSWDKSDAWAVWRAYDYVHVSTIYYGLYRAERASPGSLHVHNRTWYLNQAVQTILYACGTLPDGDPTTAYIDVGLMGETIWVGILNDLRAEGLTSSAQKLEAAMKSRQQVWASESDPFGSEMAWDSTGQEGVYAWSRYFGDEATQTKTLNSIRGYMPTVAHWGWNGNARRYWDFLYAGKLQRIERMIHHYGSGLNALPLLSAYKYNSAPSGLPAIYDLRVAYGGHMGPLSNIQADGFGAQAFHSWPDTLAWEAYSGDYGPNFLGHVTGAATYLLQHPNFGWISFGGSVAAPSTSSGGSAVTVQPRDLVRRRIYVAPMGLAVEFDAGAIQDFTYTLSSKSLEIDLVAADGSSAKSAIMTFEQTLSQQVKLTTTGLKQQMGGYVVPFPSSVTFALA